jgi:hypothetical protein
MPEQGERETVSIEAHQRVTQERDDLKSKVAELSSVATDVAKLNSAYSHFKGKEAGDPYGLAQAAIQNVTVLDAEGEDFPVRLDGWYEERAAMFGGPAVAPPSSDEVPEETPTVQAPRPSAAGPNPAAPGEPVTAGGRLDPSDPEYKEVLEREGLDGIRRLMNEGRYELHPDNQYRGRS